MANTRIEVVVKQGGTLLGRCELAPGQYLIGRDPACDFCLQAPGIADRHARLIYTGDRVEVEDLGGGSGGQAPARFDENGVLRLGEITLEARPLAGADANATLPPSHLPEQTPAVRLTKARERTYEVTDEVARGGMGAVLRARDLNIKRTVAMKVVLAERADDEELVQRFQQEAELTGQLEHPNIVPVHDLSVDEQGRAFYTMKFVQGVTLQEVLTQIKAGDQATLARYPLAQLLTIFQKVCDAVAYAHSKRVVHRDLKPPNIMIGEYGEVLVMDWGLAKVIGGETADRRPQTADRRLEQAVETPVVGLQSAVCGLESPVPAPQLTLAGSIMGSPQYMAPEQAAGKVEEIDARTDIFALGGMLYHLLTLHPPVSGENIEEMLRRIKAGEILPPTSYNARTGSKKAGTIKVGAKTFPQPPLIPLRHCPGGRIPESLGAVAMKALALKREDRYQTVRELQQDIEAYQGGFATQAEHAGAWRQIGLLVKRHRKEFALAAAAVAIIVVLVVGFMVRVVHEKNRAEANERRAETTLESLRKTAPAFYNQALGSMRELKFDAALESIKYAIELRPAEPEYHRLRGDLLQTLLRMDEARAAYRAALERSPEHALARENAQLCEKLLAEYAQQQRWPRPSLIELQGALLRQGRFDEARALLARIGKDQEAVRRICDELIVKPRKGTCSVYQDGTGLLRVTMQSPDLAVLKGLPIDELVIPNVQVTDLSPLRGMELSSLSLVGNPVSDLRPLEGMPLRKLQLGTTRVADLSPLHGMPLIELLAGFTQVANIAPLHGMPLTKLDLGACAHVADLAPLAGMPLTWLVLSDTSVTDLRPLLGLRLTWLSCGGTGVQDLSVLRGMPLQTLFLNRCPITDLTPLRGLPLRNLDLGGCTKVQDLAPLADCPQLERLIIPATCKNIEFLRTQPALRDLGYVNPPLPVAEFWKQYDAKKTSASAGKLTP